MERLPPELLINIVEQLEDEPSTVLPERKSPLDSDPLLQNLRSVRLVNKSFKAAAAKLFGETFFGGRIILMEKESLRVLLELSKNSELRTYMATLCITVYEFLPWYDDFATYRARVEQERKTAGTYLNHPDATASYNKVAHGKYKKYLKEQKEMRESSAHSAILARALENLDGCLKSLIVSGLEPSPATRKITQDVGISMDIEDLDEANVDEIMVEIMRGIFWSRIELCDLNFTCLRPYSLVWPASADTHFLFSNTHLHSLRLGIRLPDDFDDIIELDYPPLEDGALGDLIKRVPQLSDLTVGFSRRLPTHIPLENLLGHQKIPYLSSFELHGLTVRQAELKRFLHRHRGTLEHLTLGELILYTGTWRGTLDWIRQHLILKTFSFHSLADIKESMHLPSPNLTDYVLRKSDGIDWTTMRGELKSTPFSQVFDGMIEGESSDFDDSDAEEASEDRDAGENQGDESMPELIPLETD